ncbi:MAG: Hpt domain-containing protein [Burkholderiales bacterium]|nr:MAG: Hpt domain-containing protein [Burkholderiales bacterium]
MHQTHLAAPDPDQRQHHQGAQHQHQQHGGRQAQHQQPHRQAPLQAARRDRAVVAEAVHAKHCRQRPSSAGARRAQAARARICAFRRVALPTRPRYICGVLVHALLMTAPPSNHLLDPEAILRLRELDPTGENKLLARVVNAFSNSVDRLLPELALARAAAVPDLTVIRNVTHTLKSSSASLGALALSARCTHIEAMARDGRLEGLPEQLDAMLHDIQQVRVALAALL